MAGYRLAFEPGLLKPQISQWMTGTTYFAFGRSNPSAVHIVVDSEVHDAPAEDTGKIAPGSGPRTTTWCSAPAQRDEGAISHHHAVQTIGRFTGSPAEYWRQRRAESEGCRSRETYVRASRIGGFAATLTVLRPPLAGIAIHEGFGFALRSQRRRTSNGRRCPPGVSRTQIIQFPHFREPRTIRKKIHGPKR